MRSSQPTWMVLAVAAVTALAVVACNSDELEHSGPPVASVQVAPPSASVVIGATVTLTASAFDASGNVLTGRKVFWAVADSNFATVSSTGVVTGRYTGTVPVAASVEGKSAVAQIQVLPVPVVAVRVSPSSRDLTVGETAQLTAEPLDAQGNVLSGRSVAWSSGRPDVATVSATGAVTARSPGNAIITATVEGKSGVGAITVSPAPVASVAVSPTSATLIVGQTLQLEAQPRDGSGRPLDGRTMTWSTNRPNVATVTSTGIVAAISPGTATITATSEGRSGTATIVIPGAQVGWASSDLAIAIVDNTGRVLGLSEGTVVITATSSDKAGTASVRVKR